MPEDDRNRLLHYIAHLDADDMGSILAEKRRHWHPHTTPSNVVRVKLLQEPAQEEPAHKARRRTLTPTARELLAKKLHANGSVFRSDLTEKVASMKSSKHPWLSSSSADFIEENGEIILVEYRTPAEPMSFSSRGVAFHHEVSLHYALLAAQEAGIKVSSLRLCFLDIKAWDVETQDVSLQPDMVQEIRQEGDRIWKDHVVAGQEMQAPVVKAISTLDDLRKPGVGVEGAADRLNQIAEQYMTWGVAQKECEAEREDLQKEAADLLPFAALPLDVDRVDAQGVRFRIDRELDGGALARLAHELLVSKQGYTEEAASALLRHPNYWTDAEYSAQRLLQAISTYFAIDPAEDPRFSDAIVKSSQWRADTLIDLVRSLDPDETIRLENFVRTGQVRMEMTAPRARADRERRTQVSGQIRETLKGVLDGVSVKPAVAEPARKSSRRP